MSPSIGTPPRFIQPPSISDTRLVIPTLTQNVNQKWDSISLTDGWASLLPWMKFSI